MAFSPPRRAPASGPTWSRCPPSPPAASSPASRSPRRPGRSTARSRARPSPRPAPRPGADLHGQRHGAAGGRRGRGPHLDVHDDRPASTVSAEIAPGGDEVVGVGMPVIVAFSDEIRRRRAGSGGLTPARHLDARGQGSLALDQRLDRALAAPHLLAGGDPGRRHDRPGRPGLRRAVVRPFADRAVQHPATPRSSRSICRARRSVAYERPGVRTMPISGGRPGLPTAAGTNLIMEKHDKFEMDSTSVGITAPRPTTWSWTTPSG